MKEIKIDLIPESDQSGFSNVAFRTKDVCLTVRDWLDFSAVVEERFPQTVYVRRMTWEESVGASVPSLPIRHRLSELLDDTGRFPPEISMGFDRNYRIDIKPAREATDWRRRDWGWIYNGMVLPSFRLTPGGFPFPADKMGPERLAGGHIEMCLELGNKNHLALAQQYLGIIRRYVSKEPLLRVEYPSYESHPSQRTAALEWIGKDAMQWAREDPKRLLAYDIRAESVRTPDNFGWGYRPVEA